MRDFTTTLTTQEALGILQKYNTESFLLQHAQIVSGILGYFARELGYEDQRHYWEMVGLLHDLDFQQWPQEHCKKTPELLREHGVDEGFIQSVLSHGYGGCTNVAPQHEMEKVLFATDELSGLLGAAALVRPSKSVSDMNLKSAKKKFKDKNFAASCSRETIATGAEMLGWSLDELLTRTLEAMRENPNN